MVDLTGIFQSFNPGQRASQGFASGQVLQQNRAAQERANQLAGINSAISEQIGQGGFRPSNSLDFEQLVLADPQRAEQIRANFEGLSKERKKAYHEDMQDGLRALESKDWGRFVDIFEDRIDSIDKLKGDPTGSQFLLDKFNEGDIPGLITGMTKAVNIGMDQGFLKDTRPKQDKPAEKPAGQREFESKTSSLTDEQRKQAVLIDLGLSPRAVGSAIQTISDKGIAEAIGTAKGTINQRAKFGELKGASRSRVIDKGVETITKIDAGLRNINSAITLLQEGAGVGAIERFLPSFKASSVALDNVQKRMALDVIGAVTFGALSQGELNLAKEVALPTGLNSEQLIDHLQKRASAQNKLRDYYNEQIQFLDEGGSVAGFMRKKDRERAGSTAQPKATEATSQVQSFNFDAQGNLIQ